jgi:hypothetical protein
MSERSELPLGTMLGAYRIVRPIGVGGMGAVYEAEHCQLGKRVALKTPCSEAGLSPEGRARFVQEGKTTSRLRHPHVVDITDVGEVGDIAYLVMEYLEGEPLSARMEREGPLGAQDIADILVPVAAALHEAHRMGIVHRDLKPDNVFLTVSVQGSIHPKLLDFGISKLLGDAQSPKLTTQNAMLGTPEYAAPEQLQGSHLISGKSDQYSLGVIIYEAATGTNPFANRSSLLSLLHAIDSGDYRRARDVLPLVDERLERIAARAMSVNPEARFPSMLAFGAELLAAASPETRHVWARYFGQSRALAEGSALPPPPAPAPKRQSIGVGTAVLLAAAGFVVTLLAATSASRVSAVHGPQRGEPVPPLRGEPRPDRGTAAHDARAAAAPPSSPNAPGAPPRGNAAPARPERSVAATASSPLNPPMTARAAELALLRSPKFPKRASARRRQPSSEQTRAKATARKSSVKTDNVDPWAR